jgi:hypothetical protein
MSVPCLKCKHYYTTFEPDMPRGCRLYQFKSTQIPALVVKRESGEDCKGFTPRAKNQRPNGYKNLNDPKMWGE